MENQCITHSECVFLTLVIQHAVCIGRIMSFMASPAVPYFSTLSHKRHDFRKIVTEQKICVLIFSSTLSEGFLNLRRIQVDIIIRVRRFSCKVPVIPVRI